MVMTNKDELVQVLDPIYWEWTHGYYAKQHKTNSKMKPLYKITFKKLSNFVSIYKKKKWTWGLKFSAGGAGDGGREKPPLVSLSQSKIQRKFFPVRLNQQVDCVSRSESMRRLTQQSMRPSRKVANLSEASVTWILQFGSRSMPPAGEKVGRGRCCLTHEFNSSLFLCLNSNPICCLTPVANHRMRSPQLFFFNRAEHWFSFGLQGWGKRKVPSLQVFCAHIATDQID